MRKTVVVLGVVLVLLLAIAAPAYARPAQWTTIGTHIVRAGETLYCVGRAYGVSPSAIASYNGLANANKIYVGQKLAIPNAYASLPAGPVCARQFGGSGGCVCTSYHTVKSGENLYRISAQYGVNMWRAARCNNILNLNYVRAGSTLCIPCS